jgi:hypothetical protein
MAGPTQTGYGARLGIVAAANWKCEPADVISLKRLNRVSLDSHRLFSRKSITAYNEKNNKGIDQQPHIYF